MAKDYYNILGVEKGASQDEIKKAFRKKAHTFHPDKEGGDEEKFKEANEAYQVLGDPEKRQKYDQFGSAAFDGGGFPGGGGGGQGFGGFDFSGFSGAEDLGDIFGDLFGGGRRRHSNQRQGQDIQIDLELEFKDVVYGSKKEISVTKNIACERCGGNGAEPGEGTKTCGDCGGDGVHITQHRTILGVMQGKQTCGTCQGSGEIPEKNCHACKGSGLEKKEQTMTISIPAGVDNGAVLRLRGEGEAIKGGPSGDLYVRLHVRSDRRFERDGVHIRSEVDIGFTQAALGDKIDVETVDGPIELKIPAGTQSGSQFRLRSKGIMAGGGRGDHFVKVHVLVPEKLSRKQKKLIEELDLKE